MHCQAARASVFLHRSCRERACRCEVANLAPLLLLPQLLSTHQLLNRLAIPPSVQPPDERLLNRLTFSRPERRRLRRSRRSMRYRHPRSRSRSSIVSVSPDVDGGVVPCASIGRVGGWWWSWEGSGCDGGKLLGARGVRWNGKRKRCRVFRGCFRFLATTAAAPGEEKTDEQSCDAADDSTDDGSGAVTRLALATITAQKPFVTYLTFEPPPPLLAA